MYTRAAPLKRRKARRRGGGVHVGAGQVCTRENARALVGLLARGGSEESRANPQGRGHACAEVCVHRELAQPAGSNTSTVYPARSADAAAGSKRPKGAGQPSRFVKAWEGPLVSKLTKRVRTGED